MVVLYFNRMNSAAKRAFFILTVHKTHLTDVLAATGHFNAYDSAVIKDVHPVIIVFTLILEVHDPITPLFNSYLIQI